MAVPTSLTDPSIIAPFVTATQGGTSVPVYRNRKLTAADGVPDAGTFDGRTRFEETPLDGLSVEELQARMDASPLVQEALANGSDLREAMHLAGIPTEAPHDYTLNTDTGQYERDSFWERNPWAAGTIGAGAALTGGLALAPLLAGGGASAAGGAGAAGAAGAGGAGAAGTGASLGLTGALGALPATTTTSLAPLASLGAAGATTAGTGAAIGLPGALGAMPAATTTSAATGLGGTLTGAAPAMSAGTLAPSVGASGVGAGAGGGMSLSSILTNPETWSTVAGQLGRLGEAQAGERGLQNQNALTQAALQNAQYNTQQNASLRAAENTEAANLTRSQLGISAPSARTRQAILGSIIQNLQPVSFSNTGRVTPGHVSGGLTPALLNDIARQAGGELQNQALEALITGSDIPETTDFQSALLPPPDMPEYQGPGAGESLLSGVGIGGSLWQAIQDQLARQGGTRT